MKDVLFLLMAPFKDGEFDWYCTDCAALEGALIANLGWANRIDVRRVAFPRPRNEVIEFVGEDNQSLPVLVMDGEDAASEAKPAGRYAILTDVRAIGRALAQRHGGAGPHP